MSTIATPPRNDQTPPTEPRARLRPPLRFPSPALFLSCLALFAALGGGAYAAASSGTTTVSWTNAKLINGWQAIGGSTALVGYAKDSAHVVHLRGTMRNGVDDATAFVLPRGMRPRHTTVLSLFTTSPGGELEINADGTVLPIGGGDTTYTSLDGISFVAGQ